MSPVDLIQAYFENELSEAECQALQRWLGEDPAHLEQLVLEAFIDGQLRDVLGQAKVRQDLLSLAHGREPSTTPEAASVPAPHAAQSSTFRRQPGGSADARRFFPTVAAVVAVVASLAACVFVVVAMMTRERMPRRPGAANVATQPEATSRPAASARPSIPSRPDSSPIAQLSRVVGVRWSGEPLQPGQRLAIGQALALDAGVLELTFDLGARVVVQAPAVVKLESPASLRLEKGKLSAEITDVRARGFCVDTAKEKIVDQGTEFGVEVTPQGSSRIHVFKGAVDIASTIAGKLGEQRRLLAHSGARREGNSASMLLLEDTGDSFIRSVDEAGRDRHVVAYWRFEDRPVGVIVPDTQWNQQPVCATVDSSFNGNDLYTYEPANRPTFSDQVPARDVPQTGRANRTCLDTSQPVPKNGTRNVYTRSAFSHASPIDIQKITPAQWTIEVSVCPQVLTTDNQTFVGRDAYLTGTPHKDPARLAFQVNSEKRFEIHFADVKGRFHASVARQIPVQAKHWYHLAAVSDGKQLRLYVDTRDGHGYQLAATTALPADGQTALGKGADDAEWSIGRGRWEIWPGELFRGLIDEVRVSDVARKPEEFLFSTPLKSH